MKPTVWGGIGTVACVLTCATQALHAEIPNHGPDAYTEVNYYDDVVNFLRQTMSDAYERQGRRDPKWDATVKKLLDGNAKRVANGMVSNRANQPAPTHQQMLKLGQDAVAAGCDDPIMLFVHGTTLRTLERRNEAIEFLRRASDTIMATDYCIMLKGLVINRYLYTAPKDIPRRLELSAIRDQLYHEAMLGKQLTGFAKRFMIEALMPARSIEELKGYVDAGKDMAERDVWAYHLMCGWYHIDAGWKARGSGWASEVKPEGWQGFAEHLDEAARHLTAAWQAQPTFPEAPTSMISVAMAGHANEPERVWFNRAVRAQFDHMAAYGKLTWALRPRWGGSQRQMLDFAIECANTRRYDTEVPWQFSEIIDDIVEDQRGDLSIYRQPGVYEAFMTLFDGMRKEPRRAKNHEYLRGYQAATAWRCGRPDVARPILDEMGDAFPQKVWGYVHARPDEAIAQIVALTGPQAERFAQADGFYGRGDGLDAMRAFQEARDALDPADAGRAHANRMIQLQRWRMSFGGGPVQLCGDDDLTENGVPPGWGVVAGQWSRPDAQTLVGVADDKGLEARVPMGFGNRWEFTGTIDATDTLANKDLAVGVVVNHPHGNTSYQVAFYPHGRRAMLLRLWKYGSPVECDVPLQIPFKIQRWDDRYTVFLGERMVISNEERGWAEDDRAIGLGGVKVPQGTAIRFTHLTIRRLPTAPAWFDPNGAQ